MGCTQSSHLDSISVSSGSSFGRGGDIDAAVLAATNFSQGGLSNKLQLGFKCEDLPNMDTFSKSDPFVVLYKFDTKGHPTQIGKTEVIHDNLNPEFIKKILVDFHFEQKEMFRIAVYDSDDDSQMTKDLSRHDYIGALDFTLHEVVTARDQIMTKPMVN